MDAIELLTDLNPQQQHAVTTQSQYTLVLAGAGSGKTRVLVHRIAWLCREEYLPAHAIFAVTFTNKAAAEMQHRIKSLMGESGSQGMWVGTFHGLSHRLLRLFSKQAGLSDNFQLIDSDDQVRIVKHLMRELHIDEQRWLPKQMVEFIAAKKEEGIRPEALPNDLPDYSTYFPLYTHYQRVCEEGGYVDFSELLLRSFELLKRDASVLNYCRMRFNAILIDEFQDTNQIQYQFIQMLAGEANRVMVVGDDDQSIYGWRGASSDNLNKFIQDHPSTEVIRLEQNYRSTGAILNVANHLIAKNEVRLGKNLWTEEDSGESIRIYMGFNDTDEARYVVNQIRKHQFSNGKFIDCAILYRNNAQSRVIEDALMQADVPYQIYGSIRFYERQEVKRALAYLRLLRDPHNNMAFEYVVNTPVRGIGDVTLSVLHQIAKQENMSLWDSAKRLLDSPLLKAKPKAGLRRFIELIETMTVELEPLPFYEQLSHIVYDSGLYALYEQEGGIKAQTRLDNLKELLLAAQEFSENYNDTLMEEDIDTPMTDLDAFLAHTSLEGKNMQSDLDAVQVMTLHSAKGLEFDRVFIVGMEEGIFPGERAQQDESGSKMEEERRLAYVGITRARKQVTLSFCQTRRLYGRDQRNPPSRFLNELPKEDIKQIGYQMHYQLSPVFAKKQTWDKIDTKHDSVRSRSTVERSSSSDFDLGQRVRHTRFGEGTIVNMDGEGAHTRVQVAFVNKGIKWLVLKLANLTRIK